MFGGQTSAQAGGERSGRKIKLDLTDVALIRDNVPLVSAVSAENHDPQCDGGARLSPAEHDRPRGGTGLRQDPQYDSGDGPLDQRRGLPE